MAATTDSTTNQPQISAALEKKLQEPAPAPIKKREGTIHKFMRDQVPVIISAVALSISLYRLAPLGLAKISQLIPNNRLAEAQHAATMEALQIIYDEIIELRRDTLDIQTQVAERFTATEEEQRSTPSVADEQMQMFDMHDFESVFRMKPSSVMEIDPALAKYFDNYELTEDKVYQESAEDYDKVSKDYAPLMGQDSMEDRRMFVQWSNNKEAYSLYSSVHLPAKTFLGTFAGVITNRSIDPSLTWRYKGSVKDEEGKPLDLVIDGHQKGNWFHFLQIEKSGNVEAFFLPFENQWYIGFRTSRAIQPGEELVLSSDDLE